MRYPVVNRRKPILYVYPIHKKVGKKEGLQNVGYSNVSWDKAHAARREGQIGEGGQVQARNHGTTGDQTLPEVNSVADQEVTFPEAGERNRAGLQDRPSFSGSSHTMSPRGGRGILGETV